MPPARSTPTNLTFKIAKTPLWGVTLAALVLWGGCSDDPGSPLSDLGIGGEGILSDSILHDAGPAPAQLKIHTVDVGTGLCVLVELPGPGQPVLLADCGQDVWKDAGVPGATVSAYVRQIIGKRKVALIVSHPHSDHYSLVDNVLDSGGQSLDLTTVWLSSQLKDYTADGSRMLKRLDAFRKLQPAKVHDNLPSSYHSPYPAGEPDLTFGPVKAYVLAVNESVGAAKPDINGTSLVLLLKYGSFMAVLPGDADGEVQALAIQHAKTMGLPLSQAALLLAAHHGSGTAGSNDQTWADAVRPQVVVYSAGRDVKSSQLKMHHSHPYHTVVSRFAALPSLSSALSHELYQGLSGGKAASLKTKKAHFLSASNGVVVVSSNGTSGNLTVTCKAHPGTTRDTTCGLSGP